MATLTEIKTDAIYWQRLLSFAGIYHGEIDGIVGPLTRAAEVEWDRQHADFSSRLGSVDARSEKSLETLIPLMAYASRKLLIKANEIAKTSNLKGVFKITDATRSYAEQRLLYAKGRTKSGSVVTNATAGKSMHNFGIAIDLCYFEGGAPSWEERYLKHIGEAAASVGLEWGGEWATFEDLPHVQYQSTLSTKNLRKHFESGKPFHQVSR